MGEVFRGIRPVDWMLAVALSALGSLLMVADIGGDDPTVRMHSRSWWMLPVFLVATAVVLWWRRSLIAVISLASAAMLLHDVSFGYVVRCGAALPVTFVFAFLAGLAYTGRKAGLALGLTLLFATLVLVRDSAAGIGILPVVVIVSALLFGAGHAVRQRSAMAAELSRRNQELTQLRDQRVALEVSVDRTRLSRELDGLLDRRLDQLSRAAEGADLADPEASRAALTSIETDSRKTLDDMRSIIGALRGDEVALTPVPSVAHLDALLARHARADARLTILGDPRSLPASVELSAYRIVEHLVAILADEPEARIDVAMRFDDDALEIRVSGPVTRGADVRGAVGRARERALLHNGSLDMKVARGRASATALLPVLAG
jgi:signal transduction histidine kinase